MQVKELEPETANLKEMLREAKVALKKSKRVDYYKLLEIDSNANEFELKRAYRCAVDILCGSCSTQSCLSRRTDALLASCVALAEDCRGQALFLCYLWVCLSCAPGFEHGVCTDLGSSVCN